MAIWDFRELCQATVMGKTEYMQCRQLIIFNNTPRSLGRSNSEARMIFLMHLVVVGLCREPKYLMLPCSSALIGIRDSTIM